MALATLLTFTHVAGAHIFIFSVWRAGAPPQYEGNGWFGEAFLNIPDANTNVLTSAENYVVDLEPDFTFRTDWIDFPAGPVPWKQDSDFATIGDFLDDYIYDVSDPELLNTPFSMNFLLRFSGYLKVDFDDDISGEFGLPIWVEFGTMGYDGYRTRLFDTIYRIQISNPANGFYHENSIIEVVGLFPIEITWYNRYDPLAQLSPPRDRAGVELYSFHPGGLPWPSGQALVNSIFGPSTITPPGVIYQADDILPVIPGDFDLDTDIDLVDAHWFQTCHTGSVDPEGEPINLNLGCDTMDFDGDLDVDLDDFMIFQSIRTPPHEANQEED